MTKQEVFDKCRIEGNNVFLPEQLDRKTYEEVNKALTGIGGKWNRSAKAHVFPSDPTILLGRVQDGEKINLKKEFQFFETPVELADKIIEIAFKDVAHFPIGEILEPSAGQGALVDAIFRKFSYADVTVCELMGTNSEILKTKYQDKIKMISTPNFLDVKREGRYTYIVANPPFTKNQDIDHVMHMYDCLEPQGIMVSVMSTGWLRNNDKKARAFRTWLGLEEPKSDQELWVRNLSVNGGGHYETFNVFGDKVVIETLDNGAFKTSGTMVPVSIVSIDRN